MYKILITKNPPPPFLIGILPTSFIFTGMIDSYEAKNSKFSPCSKKQVDEIKTVAIIVIK